MCASAHPDSSLRTRISSHCKSAFAQIRQEHANKQAISQQYLNETFKRTVRGIAKIGTDNTWRRTMMPPFDTSILSCHAMLTPLPPTDAERLVNKRLGRARKDRFQSSMAYAMRALRHKRRKATIIGT
jgi:hypothetical protein